jgi:hypothetical protein
MTLTPLDPDAVAAHLRPPPLADLAGKARRRNRRRRVTGAAAVLATIAAAAALTLPSGSGQPDPPAVTDAPQPRPTETYTSPVLTGPPPDLRFTIALDRTSAVAFGQSGCVVTVQLTTDAGRSWTDPGGPPPVEGCRPGTELPFDQTVLGVDTYRIVIAGRGWFTTDAGRTWTPAPADREVGEFPPGRPGATLRCEGGCDRPRAVDPRTGGSVALRKDPPFERYQQADWADPNTIWAAETPKPGRKQRASRSSDRGRTWSAPFDLPVEGGGNLVAVGPRRAYFVALGNEPRFTVYRTENGGRTWTELTMPVDLPIGVTETATGELITLGSALHGLEAWVSVDGGATFTGPMTMEAPKPLSAGLGGGLAYATDGENVVHVHDGTGWYEIRPPH